MIKFLGYIVVVMCAFCFTPSKAQANCAPQLPPNWNVCAPYTLPAPQQNNCPAGMTCVGNGYNNVQPVQQQVQPQLPPCNGQWSQYNGQPICIPQQAINQCNAQNGRLIPIGNGQLQCQGGQQQTPSGECFVPQGTNTVYCPRQNQQPMYQSQQVAQQIYQQQQQYYQQQGCSGTDRAVTAVVGGLAGAGIGAVADRFTKGNGHRGRDVGAILGVVGGGTIFCNPNMVRD